MYEAFIKPKKAVSANCYQYARELAGQFEFGISANAGALLADIEKELKSLRKDVKKLQKDVSVTIDVFNVEDTRLGKRVSRIEEHLRI